ncbi:hypothetical protein JX266_006563 [Neoarthrinium moseri]|nr:hypothetical protein JX266_006563 [Neoarthrinium moseri]
MAATVDMKLLRATKFPPEFNQKVDMQKVNLQVMKKWIASKISEILGSEDDVVTELCFNLIEGTRFPDIKSMQIQLTGFLEKETAPFCKDMWNLFLSAQSSPQGVPQELLEAKKLELLQEKLEADKMAEEARVRRENQERRSRDLTDTRDHVVVIEHTRIAAGLLAVAEIDLIHPHAEAHTAATETDTCRKNAGPTPVAGLIRAQRLPTLGVPQMVPAPALDLPRVVEAVVAVDVLVDQVAAAAAAVPHAGRLLVIRIAASGPDPGIEATIDLATRAAETLPRRIVLRTQTEAGALLQLRDGVTQSRVVDHERLCVEANVAALHYRPTPVHEAAAQDAGPPGTSSAAVHHRTVMVD